MWKMVAWRRWWALGPAVLGVLGLAAGPAGALPAFKILVDESGVYRVDFEDLERAGLEAPVASDGLAISSQGQPVPIWVEDGGDGVFGPGDHFEMVGERLAGENTWVHDYAHHNVYRLGLEGGGARVAAGQTVVSAGPRGSSRVLVHLEEDNQLIRLGGRAQQARDPWFWKKLVHNQKAPTSVPLELAGLDPSGVAKLSLLVQGWSQPHNKMSPEIFDHSLTIQMGQHSWTESWNGSEPHRIDFTEVPAAWLESEPPELLIQVPRRKEAKPRVEGRPPVALIDVVMLNWIEIEYPHLPQAPADDRRLAVTGGPWGFDPSGAEYLVFDEADTRTVLEEPSEVDVNGAARVVRADQLRRPDAVLPDHATDLRSRGRRTDYLMVVHRAFREAVEPLAAIHRRRGLEVTVADVEDIYDEFNHGIAHPQAIRDFVAHAWREWPRPAPRYLLLVGDASWDVKNTEAADELYADWTYRPGESRKFTKNKSTTYEGLTGRHRHFVPTWQATTSQGHAASDNFFADVEGEDDIPELAVGRLPVATPEEVEAIVAKVAAYVEEPDLGEWQRRVLFVTNEQRTFQHRSDGLAEKLSGEGFLPHKIYPASSEVSNEEHTAQLVDSLGSGQLFVHFIGHGGRYIWRTGPPDLDKNHDLFTLEDLEKLPRSKRLPVILSLTCYSAPFDHPTADSIGEKFLRLDERGAIGVIAASWRNSPRVQWGTVLFDELTRPGATVGEALMHAKAQLKNRMFRETYNLLGDPAVPVALPAIPEIMAQAGSPGPDEVREGAGRRSDAR